MSDFSVIGESQRRPDMPGKVSGRAQYAGDLSLPGMLHAKTKRSNVASRAHHANRRHQGARI